MFWTSTSPKYNGRPSCSSLTQISITIYEESNWFINFISSIILKVFFENDLSIFTIFLWLIATVNIEKLNFFSSNSISWLDALAVGFLEINAQYSGILIINFSISISLDTRIISSLLNEINGKS